MRPFSYRQWVACAVMIAMLFSMAAPFSLCLCAECPCEHRVSRFMPGSAIATEKSCCSSPIAQPEKGCCGPPKMPCQCQCGDNQDNDAIVHKAALLLKRPNISPSWDVVSVLHAGFADASGTFSRLDNRRIFLPPHVSLHVLLCVFLN